MGEKMFREDKAAAMAVRFLKLARGRNLSRFELLKLMYGAERACLREEVSLICWDTFYNMEKGPVMSATLTCMKNGSPIWDSVVAPNEKRIWFHVRAGKPLDVLSDNEKLFVDESWLKYSYMLALSHDEAVHAMHEEFPEWQKPPPLSRTDLSLEDVLRKGFGQEESIAKARANLIKNVSGLRNWALHNAS